MAVIQELSPHLADLIAAGEVVERPASAAKELVENAIDAGATRIQVEIENGGITYLRIMDNGCGMSPEDAPTAFKRHATSKLRTESDLAAIGTLGFRGEALAAISAVSRIDLFTKQKDMLAGQHLQLEAGTLQVHEDAGCPDGTTIIIRDLFFNTPARMKFLKKDFTEAGYVVGVVQHAALSHPEIAFTMMRDGKQVFSSPGDGRLLSPVFSVFGRDFTANMIEADRFERESISAWGYITKPHFCRPNRSMQHFFVNGRYVKNKMLQAALEEAYRNKIITGKYPSCALFLTLPLNMVDVNVHPAKTEVKFAQEQNVFQAVYIACKNALEKHDNAPIITLEEPQKPSPKQDTVTPAQQHILESSPDKTPPLNKLPQQMPRARPVPPIEPFSLPKKVIPSRQFKPPVIDCDDVMEEPLMLRSPDTDEQKNSAVAVKSMPFRALPFTESPVPLKSATRVIGELFRTYIIVEDEEGLLLLDKHAAHERILFNELRKTTQIPQQQLLTPHIAEMSAIEFAILKEQKALVQSVGFDIEPFGECSFAVRAVPAYLDAADITEVLSEIAGKLSANCAPNPDRLDDLIHMVACKAAIKAGKQTSQTELQTLCDRVLDDPEISCCPHGRPVTVRLTKYEIDKRFKRVNQ